MLSLSMPYLPETISLRKAAGLESLQGPKAAASPAVCRGRTRTAPAVPDWMRTSPRKLPIQDQASNWCSTFDCLLPSFRFFTPQERNHENSLGSEIEPRRAMSRDSPQPLMMNFREPRDWGEPLDAFELETLSRPVASRHGNAGLPRRYAISMDGWKDGPLRWMTLSHTALGCIHGEVAAVGDVYPTASWVC